MFYNRLIPNFKRELVLHVMKPVKEMFLLALELELSTFKTKKRFLRVRDIDTMLTSTPQSSVLRVENLNIMITGAH